MVSLEPFTAEMYHRYFKEYDNDPDLYLESQPYAHYDFSEEKVEQNMRILFRPIQEVNMSWKKWVSNCYMKIKILSIIE